MPVLHVNCPVCSEYNPSEQQPLSGMAQVRCKRCGEKLLFRWEPQGSTLKLIVNTLSQLNI